MFSKFSVLPKIHKFLNLQDNRLLRISRYITPTRRCSSKIIPYECGTNVIFRREIANSISGYSYNMIKYKDNRYLTLTRYISSIDSRGEDKDNSVNNNETEREKFKKKSFTRPKRRGSKKAKINCKRCKSIPLQKINIARFKKDVQTLHDAKSAQNTKIFRSKSEEMLINNSKDIFQIQLPPNNVYIEFMESHSFKDLQLTKRPTEQCSSATNPKQSDEIRDTPNGNSGRGLQNDNTLGEQSGEIKTYKDEEITLENPKSQQLKNDPETKEINLNTKAQALRNATKKFRGKIENFTNTPQGGKEELPMPKLLENTASPKVECLSLQCTGIVTSTIGESKNQPSILFKTTNSMLNKTSSGTIDASKNNCMQSGGKNSSHTKIDEKTSIVPEKCGYQSINCPKNMFGEYMSPEKLKSSTTFKTNKLTNPNNSGIPKRGANGNQGGDGSCKTPDKQIPKAPIKDNTSRFRRTLALTTLSFALGFTVYIFNYTEEALEMLKKLYLTTIDEGHFTFKVLPAISDSEQTEDEKLKSSKDDLGEKEKQMKIEKRKL